MDYISIIFGQVGGTYAFFICSNSFFHKKDFSNKRKMYDKIFHVINGPIFNNRVIFTCFFLKLNNQLVSEKISIFGYLFTTVIFMCAPHF